MIIIHVSKKSPLRPSRRVTIPALFFDIIISQHFFFTFQINDKRVKAVRAVVVPRPAAYCNVPRCGGSEDSVFSAWPVLLLN